MIYHSGPDHLIFCLESCCYFLSLCHLCHWLGNHFLCLKVDASEVGVQLPVEQ